MFLLSKKFYFKKYYNYNNNIINIKYRFWEDNVNLNIELFLCINYRHNRFIEIPKSKIYFTIT